MVGDWFRLWILRLISWEEECVCCWEWKCSLNTCLKQYKWNWWSVWIYILHPPLHYLKYLMLWRLIWSVCVPSVLLVWTSGVMRCPPWHTLLRSFIDLSLETKLTFRAWSSCWVQAEGVKVACWYSVIWSTTSVAKVGSHWKL